MRRNSFLIVLYAFQNYNVKKELYIISMPLTDVLSTYTERSRIRKGMMCKIDEFVTFMKLYSHEFQAPKKL